MLASLGGAFPSLPAGGSLSPGGTGGSADEGLSALTPTCSPKVLYLWTCLFWMFPISEIISCVCPSVLSLTEHPILLRSIHMVASVRASDGCSWVGVDMCVSVVHQATRVLSTPALRTLGVQMFPWVDTGGG